MGPAGPVAPGSPLGPGGPEGPAGHPQSDDTVPHCLLALISDP